jgi:capsular exopolysaccharide synthesis family protein
MSNENMMQAEDNTANDLNLLDYWMLIKKSRWQILSLTFIVTLLAALIVFQITPVYRSTALMLIENSKNKVQTLNDMYGEQRDSSEAFNSQVQILKSRPVAEIVIKKLNLNAPAVQEPKNTHFWSSNAEPKGTKAEQETRAFDMTLLQFENSLTVERLPFSQIVKVSFDSKDKEVAAKVANAVVEAYIENDMESRSQMTQKANAWLMQRMDGLRKNLEVSEQALQRYREQENIIDNKGVVLSGSGKQLDEVSSNLVNARMRFAEAQSAYNQVKEHKGHSLEVLESVPAVLKDATVQQMKQAESEATRKLNEYKGRYAPAHPKMIAAEAEHKSSRDALARAINAVVNSIQSEYDIARANVTAAAGAQSQTKAEIQGITRKEFQLGVLQREVDSNKALYDTFVSRAKETEVSANLQSTPGRLIDPAVVINTPLKPDRVKFIATAFILGLFAGIALVFARDYLDNTMHSVEDAEHKLKANVLGTVQILEQNQEAHVKPARAFLQDPNSVFSESIRTLRTAVLLSAIDTPHRVVMVTSTIPGEGKTTIGINLAFALGQVKKVLILDADIRRPAVGASIGDGMDEGPGLVDFLSGEASLNECIRRTSNPNVCVLPAGKRFSSPLELLSSQKFAETIGKLKDMFDVVLIDCPPLKPVSDALVLSRYASAIVYVVKAEGVPHQLVTVAIKRLQAINAPLLGVVLNQVDFSKADRYGGYSYQYQYAYGQEPVKETKSFMGIKI